MSVEFLVILHPICARLAAQVNTCVIAVVGWPQTEKLLWFILVYNAWGSKRSNYQVILFGKARMKTQVVVTHA